jgi:hypothetical protein
MGFKVKRLKTKGVKSNHRKFLKTFWLDPLLKVPAKVLDKGHRMYLEAVKVDYLIP